MQNISQRGNNFLGIMELIAKQNPLIEIKLKAAGNVKHK